MHFGMNQWASERLQWVEGGFKRKHQNRIGKRYQWFQAHCIMGIGFTGTFRNVLGESALFHCDLGVSEVFNGISMWLWGRSLFYVNP